MRFCFLAIILSLFINRSVAQNNYIEVSVSDTVMITADQFVFHLMVMPDAMYTEADTAAVVRPVNYMRREKEIRQRQSKAIDAYESWLKAAGFIASPLSIPDMMSGRGYGNYFLTYHILSVAELKRFLALVKEEPSINAVLQTATSRQEGDHEKRLYSILMDKARIKAAYIATLSDKKITGIISISDGPSIERAGWPPYSPTLSSRPAETSLPVNANYPFSGKLVVRFSVH